MSLLETVPARLQQLRLAVRTLRQGRREKTLALLAVLGFAASFALSADKVPLPEEIKALLTRSHASVWLFTAASGLTVWLFVLLWREALPRESRVEIRPSAIKGPMSFGPQDGELFLRLGRDGELGELLGYVLDDQVGMVGVMGESGAGKTSLLRSGLYQLLNQRTPSVSFIYWEALPTDPLAGLLHAIQQSLPDKAAGPQSLEDLVEWNGDNRVVVLDQIEQLDPEEPAHAPIFELLSQLGRRLPPHRVTWIVAYRREFDPVWRDFELANPHLRMRLLSLKLFSREKAKEILATLAESVDLTLEDALLDDLVRVAGGKGGVSPVDLGIGMLVLYELAHGQQRSSLTLSDYRFAGGSQGLLTGYLQDRLSRFPEVERSALLKGLLHLVDLASDQRIAEGRLLDSLAEASGLSQARLSAYFEELVGARLLEKVGRETYRLQHERIIPPLRQLTGTALAEEERARLTFQDAYRRWLQRPAAGRLLAGADLRLVLRHHEQALMGEPDEADFLRRSRRQQVRRRAVAGLAALLALGTVPFVLRWQERYRDEDFLANWGIPKDLYTYQSQLKTLHIQREITNLRWLNSPLQELEVQSNSLSSLNGMPATLVALDLSLCKLRSADDLPPLPNLEVLSISALPHFARYPKLQILNLRGQYDHAAFGLADLSRLPRLQNLSIDLDLPDLRGFPLLPELQILSISSQRGRSSLRSLTGLPALPKLKILNLYSDRSDASLSGFPNLETLEVLRIDTDPSESLKEHSAALGRLPALPKLKQLFLRNVRLCNLASLAKQSELESLNLYGRRGYRSCEHQITTPAPFPKLRSIELGGSELSGWADSTLFPRLESLEFDVDDLPRQASLPKDSRLRLKSVSAYLSGDIREPSAGQASKGGRRSNLAFLAAFPNLESLSLESGDLSGFPTLYRLKKLRLRGRNGVLSLPVLPALEVLELLQVYPPGKWVIKRGSIPAMSRLTTVNLADRNLFDLTSFPAMPHLESLDLNSSVALFDQAPEALVGLPAAPRLKRLGLSRAKLSSLSFLTAYPDLEDLDLSYTGLKTLKDLPALPKLRSLNLSGVNLKDLASLPRLSSLKILYLYETKLESLRGLPPSVEELGF